MLSVLLAVLAFLTARSSADPITLINGSYSTVSPVGSGIENVFFSNGAFDGGGGWHGTLSDLEVKNAGKFPLIDIADPSSGEAQLSLFYPSGATAVFNLNSGGWGNDAGLPIFFADATLISNTGGADLSLFAKGGTFDFSATGLAIDTATNTATVLSGATASFELAPSIPEPATAALAIVGGCMGLAWLRASRRRRVATSDVKSLQLDLAAPASSR
jgi:hypothetical protein